MRWLLVLLGLAACAPRGDVPAPGEGGPARGGSGRGSGMLGAPPIYAVLGYRQQLALSSAQVAAVDSIGDWLDERNAPLLDSLGERGEGRSGRRRGGLRGPAAVSLLERIGANNRAAVDGVSAALTAEQRSRLCQLFAEQRDERGRRRSGDRPAFARRGGAARDSLPGRGAGRWLWCAPPGRRAP